MELGRLIDRLEELRHDLGEEIDVLIMPHNQEGDCQWDIGGICEYDGVVAISMTEDTV